MPQTTYDYSKLDQPEVLQILFHPRPEVDTGPSQENTVDNHIAVDEGVRVHARFHLAGQEEPNILFFLADFGVALNSVYGSELLTSFYPHRIDA